MAENTVLTRLLHGPKGSRCPEPKTSLEESVRASVAPFPYLHKPFPLYPFHSFFTSLRKRQSVPWAMSFCGLLLIMPAACRRRA